MCRQLGARRIGEIGKIGPCGRAIAADLSSISTVLSDWVRVGRGGQHQAAVGGLLPIMFSPSRSHASGHVH